MAKKQKSSKNEIPEDVLTEALFESLAEAPETTSEAMEQIELKDIDSLEIFTEESAFLTEGDKGDIESLFEPRERSEVTIEEAIASSYPKVDVDSENTIVEGIEGSELEEFDSENIEEVEFVEEERAESIVESILFATDKPVSLNAIKLVFKGTNVKGDKIRRILDKLTVDYASGNRGVHLEEVPGGYQLRTKIDNMNFLKRTLKVRPFKLSGPALEVLAIVAYKQPLVKHEIDEIRGVESGHLLRALMEKGIVTFAGKSDLPGKPMQYVTTKKFLEIFGLRNLKELPTLSQIDELLPEGIHEDDDIKNAKLSSITDSMSQAVVDGSYSQGEDELMKLTEQLDEITTSSDFFEQEKQRQKEKREFEKAQNIREALEMGETVSTRDKNWLIKYDEAIAAGKKSIEEFEKSKEVGTGSMVESVTKSNLEINQDLVANSIFEAEEGISIDFEEKEEELPFMATDEEFEGNP